MFNKKLETTVEVQASRIRRAKTRSDEQDQASEIRRARSGQRDQANRFRRGSQVRHWAFSTSLLIAFARKRAGPRTKQPVTGKRS
jgi:hypothetical protein